METAGDAVAAILVLELDGAGGVVGIGDFTADVGDEDGDAAAVGLDDVDNVREKEMGVMLGLLVGEHGGFHLILVGGLVIVERGLAETGGGGAVEVELALGDTGEVDELEAVELVADLQGEIGCGVYDVEGLGKASTMDGELKERAIDVQARHDVGRADCDSELREYGGGDDIRIR